MSISLAMFMYKLLCVKLLHNIRFRCVRYFYIIFYFHDIIMEHVKSNTFNLSYRQLIPIDNQDSS